MNRLLLPTLALLLIAAPIHADDWPNWRGPDNDGICKEAKAPTTWGEDKNIAWKLPMPGRGGATPIVWKDKIFVTSGEGNDQVLLCISTGGKVLWKKVVGSGGRPTIKGDEANEASASPSTDGKHVYAFVGTGHVGCYDFEGKEIWKVNVQDKYGKFKIQHGLHTTPLLHEDKLYLSLIHNNGHWVVALDKASGKEVWAVKRPSQAVGESREAYSSPVLWNDGKEPCVVILGADLSTGHRLSDGKEIWRLDDLNSKRDTALRIIASPVASRDLLVVPTAREGLIVGVKPGANGLIKANSPFEQWRKTKGAPDVPSPLIHDGIVYLMQAKSGVFDCWDAKSGKEHYSVRLEVDRYRASPTYAAGNVYVASRNGTFTVIKAGPKFQQVARNNLNDAFTASPAFSNGRLYLRGFANLYAIEEGK